MAISEERVTFSAASLRAIQEQLSNDGLDGWLLYDFRGANPVAAGVLGLPPLSRRVYVYIPAAGTPIALTHRIEQQPWRTWIGENRQYLSWQSLEAGIAEILGGARRVAAEYSAGDAVPYLDRLPAGVVETIRASGAELVSSGDLVSAFYSRWGAEGEASHRRAARVLRDTAFAAFARVEQALKGGREVNEWEIRQWIVHRLSDNGLAVGADSVVAVNGNAANPHYAPGAADHAPIRKGDLLLIDLWGKENPEAIYADQTWMAYIGAEIPPAIRGYWEAIRDARDAAVDLIRARAAAGAAVAGYEVDDAARAVIRDRGYADAFIHRTGHSIDRELHGSGPNIDNLETRDERRLIPGVGFSIEPGVYFPGQVGLRTEIDVFMTANGPDVTTPEPQHSLHLIDA